MVTNMGYLPKNEKLERSLLNSLPNVFQAQFSERLHSSPQNYWQTLSEIRAIHVFHSKLDIPLIGIEVSTNGNKNVDFVCDWNGTRIFIEVKGFRPEDYEVAKQSGSFGSDEKKIDRALKRCQNKFLDNACNIVVIADEDTIKPPVFMNPATDLERTPEIYLNDPNYRKTSAVMALGGIYDDQMFKYKIWYNANPQCLLPPDFVTMLDKNKSNARWPWQN